MKRLLILALCIAFAAPAMAQYPVIIAVTHLSAQRPRITALLNETLPLTNTTLDIELYRGDPNDRSSKRRHLKLETDSRGAITLPHLHWGYYVAEVHAKFNSSGEIELAIVPDKTNRHYPAFVARYSGNDDPAAHPESAFTLRLFSNPTQKQILTRERRLPVFRYSKFRGIVCDPTGTPLPHAWINITKLDPPHKWQMRKLESNEQGAFSARLGNGEYVATFHSPEYQTLVLHIVISSEANNQPMKVILQIGVTTG